MSEAEKTLIIPVAQASDWAERCLRISHLQVLIQRELEGGNQSRAAGLSTRARQRAWELFNEIIAAGGEKPLGYEEPAADPTSE